jgi:hypothetical protein
MKSPQFAWNHVKNPPSWLFKITSGQPDLRPEQGPAHGLGTEEYHTPPAFLCEIHDQPVGSTSPDQRHQRSGRFTMFARGLG